MSKIKTISAGIAASAILSVGWMSSKPAMATSNTEGARVTQTQSSNGDTTTTYKSTFVYQSSKKKLDRALSRTKGVIKIEAEDIEAVSDSLMDAGYDIEIERGGSSHGKGPELDIIVIYRKLQ